MSSDMNSKTPRLRIAVGLGDSTTAGTPGFFSPREAPPAGRGNPESQYAYWLERLCPEWRILNRGVRGQRTDQILQRFDYDVTQFSPETVILLAGVNDLHQGRSEESVRDGLRRLVEHALGGGLSVILCSLLPCNLLGAAAAVQIQRTNAWIRSYASHAGVLFCDTYAAVADPADPARLMESPDEIHPAVAGYKKMAEALAPVLTAREKAGGLA